MMQWRRFLIGWLAVALGMVCVPSSGVAASLTFGVVPQQSASRLLEMWGPLLDDLGERSGLKLDFATAADIPTFEACLARGAYDIAYMNPYHYTTFHEMSGYQAFARQAGKKLKGLLVVRKASAIRDIGALSGSEIAFPSPAAFGASVLPRAEMKARAIDIRPRYVKSHDSVYRAVAMGLVPAGGGVIRTFNSAAPEIRDQLRVIYETGAYTPHAFAALNTVSSDDIAALMEAMLAVNREAPALLKPAGFATLESAVDADWDDVQRLRLERDHTQITVDEVDTCHSG
jgi:phosphonate transport system substrate-binding protein